MTPRHIRVLERFFEKFIGIDWKDSQPCKVSPNEALEALWGLNPLFQSNYHLIQSLPFASSYERDADRALERLAFGDVWSERDPKPIVWRVLIERHIQSMVVVQANELHGSESVAVIPQSLPKDLFAIAIALFLQYEMKLVLPIGRHLPENLQAGCNPESLIRH